MQENKIGNPQENNTSNLEKDLSADILTYSNKLDAKRNFPSDKASFDKVTKGPDGKYLVHSLAGSNIHIGIEDSLAVAKEHKVTIIFDTGYGDLEVTPESNLDELLKELKGMQKTQETS